MRAGFRMVLEAEPDIAVVGEAANGEQAVHGAQRLKPDVVLMDIRMPELDGIAATRQIAGRDGAASDAPPRVLILTTFDLDEYVYDALGAGASGFLLKDSPPEQLVSAIRVVAGGEALLAPSITSRLIEQFARTRTLQRAAPPGFDELTARELEVFKLIARGLSNAEIAASLVVGDTTVKTHVARLLAKLGLRDRVQAVVLAYEFGLVSPGPAQLDWPGALARQDVDEPGEALLEVVAAQRDVAQRALGARPRDARLAHQAQVVGGRRGRQAERGRQLAADARPPVGQQAHDLEPHAGRRACA